MFARMFITLQLLRGDFIARFQDEEGATAVEYGLLVALIAAVIVGTVVSLGGKINTAFTTVNGALP